MQGILLMPVFIVHGSRLRAVPHRANAYTRTPVSVVIEERTPRAAVLIAKHRWAGQPVEIVGINCS